MGWIPSVKGDDLARLEYILKLYIEAITHSFDDMIIKGDMPVDELYYLCTGADSKFVLEIIKGIELGKPLYDKKHFHVIGVADSRAGAFELARRVVNDFMACGRSFEAFGEYLRVSLGE